MKYETLQGEKIPKIGFGTWKIGGGMSADQSLDKRSLVALRSALEIGYTHFDTAEMYASGHSEELLGQAVRESNIPREELFITTKVSASHLRYDSLCCTLAKIAFVAWEWIILTCISSIGRRAAFR